VRTGWRRGHDFFIWFSINLLDRLKFINVEAKSPPRVESEDSHIRFQIWRSSDPLTGSLFLIVLYDHTLGFPRVRSLFICTDPLYPNNEPFDTLSQTLSFVKESYQHNKKTMHVHGFNCVVMNQLKSETRM
jgi:hypothetical protein